MEDVDYTYMAKESTYTIGYEKVSDLVAFIKNHEPEDIPERIKEIADDMYDFLIDNL